MFSYVFMKILEARPRSYDRRMNQLSGGRIAAIKAAVAAAIPSGARVLEIGCGTGELAVLLCERGAEVHGFEPNPAMLQVARQRVESAGLGGRVTLHEMGVEGMDELTAGAFDGVVSTLVFSELSDDERRFALKHAARVLRPGGTLVIADEVVPRSPTQRAIYSVVRSAARMATYLVSQSSTRPLAQLPAELLEQGFALEREERSHGEAFAMVVARRSADAPDAAPVGAGS